MNLIGGATMDQVTTGDGRGDGALGGRLKRKYHREKVFGFVGNIADGRKIIDGIVENVSPDGFEIANLPQSFTGEGYLYTAILSGGGRHYKVLTRPCWRTKKENNTVHIGFKILDAPWEWLALTLHHIPQAGDN